MLFTWIETKTESKKIVDLSQFCAISYVKEKEPLSEQDEYSLYRKDILSEIKKLTPAIKQARERLKICRELTTPQPKSTDVAIGGFTPPPQPRDDDVCLGNASKHLNPLDQETLNKKRC